MNYIVEFEGYSFPNKFIFKEVTIVNINTDKFSNFFVQSPFPRKCLSRKENNIVSFCEHNLHKIKWCSGIHSIREVKQCLSKIKAGSKIYTKGIQKVNILKNLVDSAVVVIDLEDLDCKNAAVYLSNFKVKTCTLDYHKKNEHCSFIKAQAFKNFLINDESFNTTEY